MSVEPRAALLIQAEAAYVEALAEPRKGRVTAERVAAAARDADAHEALAVALRAAGYAARDLYRHEDAGRFLGEAARVARAADLPERLCQVLITSSAMHIELGNPLQARRDLAEARAVTSPLLRAEVDFAEGLLEDTVGNYGVAETNYRRALRHAGPDQTALRVRTLNNLALTIVRCGQYDTAEQLLHEAIALAQDRLPARAGVATESLAFVAVEAGRPVDALRRYERAEWLLTSVGVQLVDLYLGKARALLTLRLLDEAAEAARRAVQQVDGVAGGSLMLAEALLPLAQIALAQERHGDAVEAAGRAEALFRRQRRAGWRARAALLKLSAQACSAPTAAMAAQLQRIERTMRDIGDVPGALEAALLQGDVCAALGRTRAAAAAFARAAEAGAGGPALLRLQGRRAAARRAELTGDTRRLAQECRLGLDQLAAYRATVASAELRARAAGHGTVLAEIGLRAALRAGRPEQIWLWLERARSVTYVRHAGRPDERLRPLLAELRALKSRFDDLAPDAGAERSSVMRKVAALEGRIRTRSWTRVGATQRWVTPSVRALRALRHNLDDRALLQYGTLEGRVYAVVVTRRRVRFTGLGSLAEAVAAGDQLAFALRRLSRPRSAAATAAAFHSAHAELRHLAGLLVDPLASELAAAGEVVVSPPGELIGVPWGALAPLADRSVRVVPSAMAWWLGRERRPASERAVLVAGPGLAAPEDEVTAIARRYHDAVRLTGAAATADAVRAHAPGAKVVHVAGHGRLRSDSPTFSSIVLADGPLTVHDLESLAAPSHHWVLAACDLGNPGALAGPALEGVLASLLSGGAAAVIAAVVSVPDLSTRDLMVALHGGLADGLPMPEALRRASREMDRSEPGGFVASTAFACYGGG